MIVEKCNGTRRRGGAEKYESLGTDIEHRCILMHGCDCAFLCSAFPRLRVRHQPSVMASFSHNSLELSFRTFGIGALPIIAFHGFGRTGEDFSVFEKELGAIATIHAFDLPFTVTAPRLPNAPTNRSNQRSCAIISSPLRIISAQGSWY